MNHIKKLRPIFFTRKVFNNIVLQLVNKLAYHLRGITHRSHHQLHLMLKDKVLLRKLTSQSLLARTENIREMPVAGIGEKKLQPRVEQ